jgi:Collagen triple helix repeat (20 copies)
MKKHVFILTTLLLYVFTGFAQSPQAIKYQGVARNSAGAVLNNQSITVQVSMHDLTGTGAVVYKEVHTVTTNAFGLYNLNLGQGTPVSGTFSAINWGSGAKYIEQEVDFGSGLVNVGTSQFLSVPYALYSLNGTPGANGATGPIGLTGATGLAGTNGANGAIGATGLTGATGLAGTNGTNGTNGAIGATGLTGASGSAGTNGTNGTNGAIGATGLTGATGSAGTNGTNGTNGATGATGLTGAIGATGSNGTNGATGATGAVGANGATGNNGTNGTNGATGATGAVGANGATGNNGTNGTNGATGATGTVGANGATGSNGTNGTNGATGATGAVGANGATGSNGTNGTNGATGANGAIGATGSNGTNGATGATGTAGANGSTGATGNNGTNGATGATGATGSNGTNGTAGANGTNGATGVTGPTGPGSVSGTTNYISKFTSATGLGNSTIQDNGTSISMGLTTPSVIYQAYIYRQQLTVNGDGQSSLFGYRTRDSQNDGVGYSQIQTNRASSGYSFWGDVYTFGDASYNYNDYSRCGGSLGADVNGTYWGSNGYRSSGLLNYGVYGSGAYASGGGLVPTNEQGGVGGGFFGMIGAMTRGSVIGQLNAGDLFASYNMGDVYTSGKNVELVTVNNEVVANYAVTSNVATAYNRGKAQLVNGTAHITFDASYAKILGEDPIVTVTPMGESNGVYITSVDKTGFTVKESKGGTSTVEISWIAVGTRVDAASTEVPAFIKTPEFNKGLDRVLFNDGNRSESGEGLWWDGTKLQMNKNYPNSINLTREQKTALLLGK